MLYYIFKSSFGYYSILKSYSFLYFLFTGNSRGGKRHSKGWKRQNYWVEREENYRSYASFVGKMMRASQEKDAYVGPYRGTGGRRGGRGRGARRGGSGRGSCDQETRNGR